MLDGTSNVGQNNALQSLYLPVEFSQQQRCFQALRAAPSFAQRMYCLQGPIIQGQPPNPIYPHPAHIHSKAIKLATTEKQTNNFQLEYKLVATWQPCKQGLGAPATRLEDTQYGIFCPALCRNLTSNGTFSTASFKKWEAGWLRAHKTVPAFLRPLAH